MKIELDPVYNPEAIIAMLKIDDMYKNIVIEEPIDEWQPNLEVTSYFFIYKDDKPIGILALERFCSNGLMFHGGIFAAERGKESVEILTTVLDQVREKTGRIIMTTISTSNEIAIKLAKKVGLVEKCIIKDASKKGDMMILAE